MENKYIVTFRPGQYKDCIFNLELDAEVFDNQPVEDISLYDIKYQVYQYISNEERTRMVTHLGIEILGFFKCKG